MHVCYNKLWKRLIDLRMKRIELRRLCGISTCTLAKLGKDENVTLEVLKKICGTLNCDIGDIMEFIPDDNGKEVPALHARPQKKNQPVPKSAKL